MQSFSVQSRSSFPQEFARLACTLHFGRQPHICCAISPTRRLADLLLLYICYGIARVFSIGLGSPRSRGGFKPETIVCQRKAINFNCIRCHCPLVQPSRLTAYSFSPFHVRFTASILRRNGKLAWLYGQTSIKRCQQPLQSNHFSSACVAPP